MSYQISVKIYVKLIVIFLLSTVLLACTENTTYSTQQGHEELSALTSRLTGNNITPSSHWPYSEAYLAQRHTIYQQLQQAPLTAEQQATLDYLIINQRYVRRFIPWPSQSAVLSPTWLAQNPAALAEAANWLALVHQRLQQGENSKIRLNTYQLAQMQQKLQALKPFSEPYFVTAHSQLSAYLANYSPRNRLGLSQLPNGSQWYQSKLNYFAAKVQPPLQWLTQVQQQLKSHASKAEIEVFIPQIPNKVCSGFDWQQGFCDRQVLPQPLTLSQPQQRAVLALMEVDLGVHYQLWTTQQAMQSLKLRGIKPSDAQKMLDYILRHPAQSFIYAQALFHSPAQRTVYNAES